MDHSLSLVRWIAAAALVAGSTPVSAQTCQPVWNPSFSAAGALNGNVYALATFDDGAGPALHAGGAFTAAGATALQHVAKWTGSSWAPLGGGLTISVACLAVFDDGSGPQLYAGGSVFVSAPNTYRGEIHRWNGASWSLVAVTNAQLVSSFAVYDPGTGPALYGSGAWSVSPLPAGFVARVAPGGFTTVALANLPVADVLAFDDGAGAQLYATGAFSTIDSVVADRVARWDGASWSAVGAGLGSSGSALAVCDVGAGPQLYAGGGRLEQWTGASWVTVGGGVTGLVHSLAQFDDGSGPGLYVGGPLTAAGPVPVNRIARWDGSSWSALGTGLSGPASPTASALLTFDDGACSGPSLIVGGNFTNAGASGDAKIARWRCPAEVPSPGCSGAFCAGDGLDTGHTTACPCGNFGAAGNGCAHSFSAAGARLALAGTANPDTLVLGASNLPASSFALYMQHDAAGDHAFHDGVLCAGGNLIRLRGRVSVGGASTFPDSTDTLDVSTRGLVTPGSGAVRYYAAWYRNASTSFCPPATANVTNGAVVYW